MRGLLKKLLRERSVEFYVAGVLLWLLPGLILLVLGLVYLWQAGWFWWFSGALLALAAMSWAVRWAMARPAEPVERPLPHLEPRPEWSEHDRRVWDKSLARIEEAELATVAWEDVPRAMFDHITYVARVYHGDKNEAEFSFTLPELLLMLETWSREYRAQVVRYMPLAHDIKISTLRNMSRRADTAWRLYSYSAPLVTALRIGINPLTGLAREFSSQLASKYMGDLGQLMQRNVRVLLFEEVTQVGIELYSGRLKFSREELAAYREARERPEEFAVEPLSVFVVGQVNAGKSSLINALKKQSVAEVDALPATNDMFYHPMRLENELDVLLVDTPGLDGGKKSERVLLDEVVKADLVLWVVQANQPAKALDKQFFELWSDFFERHLARKKPPVVLVTTHNDRLSPAVEWSPPYDLSDSSDAKVETMLAALEYSHQAIGLPAESRAVPVAVLPGDESWNIDVLHELLVAVSGEARSAQLNRQRLGERSRSSAVWDAVRKTTGLVKLGAKIARK